jgi:L-ascorbate metabolism protein UlaG (beta-lactamase superfamily)
MDVARALDDDARMNHIDRVTITHIGGPTVLLEIGDLRVLTDPTFDARGRSYTIPRTGSVIAKLVDPALDVSALGHVDAVLLSHDEHADNLDDAGRALVATVPVTYTTSSGALRLGGTAIGLAPWQTARLGPVTITAVPGRHGPPGCEPLLGDVIGFVLTWPEQRNGAVYVSGDTVWYDDLAAIGRRFSLGTGIMHIGRVERDGTRFTMSAADASTASRMLSLEQIIPVHYDGWQHFSEGAADARAAFDAAGLHDRVLWLEPGIATELTA